MSRSRKPSAVTTAITDESTMAPMVDGTQTPPRDAVVTAGTRRLRSVTLVSPCFVPCVRGTRTRLVASDTLTLVEHAATGRITVTEGGQTSELCPAAIAVVEAEG